MMHKAVYIFFFLLAGVVLSVEGRNRCLRSVAVGIEQGLSNNSVTAFYQDPQGFMWIGTMDGLNRYDGYEFLTFRHEPGNPLSLVDNRIVSVAGKEGEIWIGTKKGFSVYHIRTGRFERGCCLSPESGRRDTLGWPVNRIEEYEGKIYVATAGKGLWCSSRKTAVCRRIPLLLDGKTVWDYHVQGMDFDDQGQVWAFVQGVGIVSGETGSPQLRVVSAAVKSGHCVALDDESNLWVGLDDGLMCYHLKDSAFVTYSHPQGCYPVRDVIYVAAYQQVWAATDGGGMICYDLNTSVFTAGERLSGEMGKHKSVCAVYSDREGRNWAGTLREGAYVIVDDDAMFRTVVRNPENETTLPGNFVLSFCERGVNRLWIGTDGNGACLWNYRNSFRTYRHDPKVPGSLPNDFVTAMMYTRKGVWFGTYGGGISLFDEKTETFRPYELYNPKLKRGEKYVWVLFKDADYDLWAGSSEGPGLFRYSYPDDRFDYIPVEADGVISMTQDLQKKLWVGTFNRLIRFDKHTLEQESYPMEYPVRALRSRNKNTLLVGTEGGGLIVLNPETRERRVYTEADGLPNNSVLNIVEDNNGFYWLSTFKGISRFDIYTGLFTNYDVWDGLPGNQLNYNAALKLSNGNILFGGIAGVTEVNPMALPLVTKFPQIVVTGVRINNKPMAPSVQIALVEKLQLSADSPLLSVDFAGLEYARPQKIRYAYFLEGWDSEWHYTRDVRQANYSGLREGEYVLQIKSTDIYGNWNEELFSLPVEVFPPWYRSWWAWLMYLMAVAGAGYLVARYLKRQNQLIYEIQLSKAKIRQEKELNEKKFNFFTMLAYEFRAPLTMIINPLKEVVYDGKAEREALEMAYRSSRHLRSLVDDLLLFQKVENEEGTLKVMELNLVEVAQEVFSSFIQQAQENGIRLEFLPESRVAQVYGDRQKLETCLFGILSNALKFARPDRGRVVMRVCGEAEELVIKVADNGPGVADQEKERIFNLFYQGNVLDRNGKKTGFGVGLYMVRKFITRHHGTVYCLDNTEGGATFEIRLKKGKAHFDEKEIVPEEEQVVEQPPSLSGQTEVAECEELKPEAVQENNNLEEALKYILVVSGDVGMLSEMETIFTGLYRMVGVTDVTAAFRQIRQKCPDMIITEALPGSSNNGTEFCKVVKQNENTRHIPVLMLTPMFSEEIKLQEIEGKADEYITKPFDKAFLLARISSIFRLKSAEHRFVSALPFGEGNWKLTDPDKEFIDQVTEYIEKGDENFNVTVLSQKMGMSASLLYKKVRQLTGKTVVEWMRYVRLRKAAMMMITTDLQINEIVLRTGFSDTKYFRKLFQQQYQMSPSAYQKKYKIQNKPDQTE